MIFKKSSGFTLVEILIAFGIFSVIALSMYAVFWNGINNNGSPVTSGPYILYVEMFNTDGESQRNKQMFVVAYK